MLGRPRGREQRKRRPSTVSRRTARPQSTARNDKDANAAPHGAAKHATDALLERKRKYAQRECKYAQREPLARHFARTLARHLARSSPRSLLVLSRRMARRPSPGTNCMQPQSRSEARDSCRAPTGGNAHSRHTPMMTEHAQRGVT